MTSFICICFLIVLSHSQILQPIYPIQHPIDPLPTNNLCLMIACPLNKICVNGQCVDQCSNMICPMNQYCLNGQCINQYSPIMPLPAIPQLPPTYTCSNIYCGPGMTCINGACVTVNTLNQCYSNYDCPAGQSCNQGTCVVQQNCFRVKCPMIMSRCSNVVDDLSLLTTNNCCNRIIRCTGGTICYDGRCIVQPAYY
jgi:hypothetical protein